MKYTNSELVSYKKISPYKTSLRNHNIDTITIHCMAGNLSVESCGNVFQTRSASSNYGIGSDGRIALYVDEKDRSWATSSPSNDHRAVTIEVANDGGADTGWHVSDKAMESLIELITDICKRNNIKKLLWRGDKSLIGQVDKQNMTVHRWFANKSCPGDYLYEKHSYIAEQVNKKLNVKSTKTFNTPNISTNVKTLSITNVTSSLISKLKIVSNVKSVQIWLNTYYKAGLIVDGIYGSKTKSALIKAWQTEAGNLTVCGVFESNSKKASASHVIKMGSTGILVTIWQAYLVCGGYNPNGIDGLFGTKCHTATIAFQKVNGLTQDGKVGKNTWSKAFC